LASQLHDLLDEITEKEEFIEDQNQHISLLDDKLDGFSELISLKDDLIIKKDQDLEEAKEKLNTYIAKEEKILQEISTEEKFVSLTLSENNKKMGYRQLLSKCEDKFDGLRLVLKKMKEKGIVEYDGILPGFSSEIELLRDVS
jgi:oligoendopeptidase F